MRTYATRASGPNRTTPSIRRRIEKGGERLWRFEDFRDLPFTAVAQALSRLTRQGRIERLSKGVYYRPRQSAFGNTLPSPVALQRLAAERKTIFPAGLAAANVLGFTTQSAGRGEVSTSSLSLPRKLIGAGAVVHTRRPEAWAGLAEADAALLEFLRQGGKTSDLSPQGTIDRMLTLLSEKGRFGRLLKIANSEPPRVRAILGAAGEQIGIKPSALRKLRDSLNPLSRFDFGLLAGLTHSREWHAKDRR